VEDSTVQQPKQNQDLDKTTPNLSVLDKFFASATVSSLFGGTISTVLLTASGCLVPIVPAIFFGLGISSLVYHFMGGIKPDTKIKVGAVTLTGTLGSLVAIICILNTVFENQIEQRINASSLLLNPEENNLLALNKHSGEAVKVNIGIKDIPINGKAIEVPAQLDLDNIKELCRDGEGFCKEEKDANFEIDKLVPPGRAKVCHNQTKKYLGYPFFLEKRQGKERRVQRVIVSLQDNCIDQPDKPITIKIHPSDAVEILGESTKGAGKARIASLRNIDEIISATANIAQR
jgi:hypothetical protein